MQATTAVELFIGGRSYMEACRCDEVLFRMEEGEDF